MPQVIETPQERALVGGEGCPTRRHGLQGCRGREGTRGRSPQCLGLQGGADEILAWNGFTGHPTQPLYFTDGETEAERGSTLLNQQEDSVVEEG